MKAYITKTEILRITAKDFPDFTKCPLWVEVEVFNKPSKLITTLRTEKHATLKPIRKIIVK